MNSLFLSAKHWQIFVPLVSIPILLVIASSIIVTIALVNKSPENPEDGIWFAYFMPFIGIISLFTFNSPGFGMFSRIKPVELQSPVTFSDFSSDFFPDLALSDRDLVRFFLNLRTMEPWISSENLRVR